ncbi:MAG: hypothetical protein IH895_09945, partial [Planctomycetes bacterium]|nr:hypothetical protein [Planctomycetota bacterium]
PVIGILPDADTSRATPDLDYAIVTGMGDARNLINVLSSDVVIACTGGAGTMSEVALALKNGKRVILLGWDAGDAFADCRQSGLLTTVQTAAEAIEEVSASVKTQGVHQPE